MKSSLNPDFKGGESWGGGAPRPPRNGDSDSPVRVPGPPEPWEEREAAGPALCSLDEGPCLSFPAVQWGQRPHYSPPRFPPGCWWVKLAGAGAGSGQAGDEVTAALGAGAAGLGVAAGLLPICWQPGLASTGRGTEGSPRVQGLWRVVLPSALLLRLPPLQSPWIRAVAAAQLAPWQWWDGYEHTWEAGDGSSVTLTAPFPPERAVIQRGCWG